MEDFIHNIFDIKNINNIDYIYSTQIYFKNQKGNEIFFYLKDYLKQTNLITINLENTENRFLSDDFFYLKYKSDNNIKVFCMDPYSENIIENNYTGIGITNIKKNKNYLLLKIVTDKDTYILNITFKTLDKNNLIIPHNLPIEMKIFFENNEDVDKFINKLSINFSKILDYSKDKIILIEIDKKILISCVFLILPDKEFNQTSELCEKILDLLTIKNTINKYEESILKVNSQYHFFVNNFKFIEYIKKYSNEKFFYGLQIKSCNYNMYESDININKLNNSNTFKIKNADKYTEIILQLKKNNYNIEYSSDNKETMIKGNNIVIKSNSCYLNLEVSRNIENILVPNTYSNIEIKEVNKFQIKFKFYPDDSIFKEKRLFSNFEINKIKIVFYSILFGIFGGIIYSKLILNENKEEETFIPESKFIKINNNIMKEEINDSKYKKYNLDKDFFNETIDNKDLELISKLGLLKKKQIFKKY